MTLNTNVAGTLAAFFILVTSETLVAQTNLVAANCAVAELNAKLDYSVGDINSSFANLFDVSLTLPVTHQTGLQADGLYSRISDLNFSGGAAHAFWRDPDIGLLGLTGGYLYREGANTYANNIEAGAEGELYLGRFTLGGFAGVGSINFATAQPSPIIPIPPRPVDGNPTRFVGRLRVDYYPIDDLRVGASFTTAFKNQLGQGDLEYQTPINGLALTAEVAYGDYGYHHFLFGVRYYFGGKKSLRDRQRQDDPPGLMREILDDLEMYNAELRHDASPNLRGFPPSTGWSGGPPGGFSLN